MFGVLSYTGGLGLWGLGYSPPVQKVIFRDPHGEREKDARVFLNSEWRQERYFQKLKEHFPSIPDTKRTAASFQYEDFEFAIVCIYETATNATKERIVTQRETIGLLQSLILSTGFLALVLGILAIMGRDEASRGMGVVCGGLFVLTTLVVFMLCVHFRRRNHYLVRDVLMAFMI
jgi:hypothetical protein